MGSDGEKRLCVGREIIIDAPTDAAAERVFCILRNAATLLAASDEQQLFGDSLGLYKELGAEGHRGREPGAIRGQLFKANLPAECLIAIKVASRLRRIYALAKLALSYRLLSIPSIDLDPTHSLNIQKTHYENLHVAFAYAIIAAYSAIEEIGLEVRASTKTPSTVKGVWNPPVLLCLERRLRNAGIQLDEPFHWDIRGGKTRLERDRPPKVITKSPWSRWHVRDGTVKIVDAIAHVSWLRSRVSAHRATPEYLKVLSVYDVANAQFLARRLLLEKLNCWKIWDEFYP